MKLVYFALLIAVLSCTARADELDDALMDLEARGAVAPALTVPSESVRLSERKRLDDQIEWCEAREATNSWSITPMDYLECKHARRDRANLGD